MLTHLIEARSFRLRAALIAAAALALLLGNASTPAQASIQAYELIGDARPFLPGTDLFRFRDSTAMPFNVETDDATITADNSLNNFGNITSATTSYTHRLDWLAPAAGGVYESALLLITANYIDGSGESAEVTIEGDVVGALNDGAATITLFNNLDVAKLSDDLLMVSIDSGTELVWEWLGLKLGLQQVERPDRIEITGSKLVVKYEPSVIPEPGSVFIWSLIGGLGLVASTRKSHRSV